MVIFWIISQLLFGGLRVSIEQGYSNTYIFIILFSWIEVKTDL